MIVEPVRAHGLVPVAGDLVDSAAAIGAAGMRVGGVLLMLFSPASTIG